MATMRDVAKLAGVSVTTVSFVLNGTAKEHKVADETAQKVIHAARDLNYQINSSNVTRSFQMKIALFLPYGSATANMEIITASANRHMKKCGKTYNILLCLYERDHLSKRIRQLSPSEYDTAVIIAETDLDRSEFEQLPGNLPLILFHGESTHFSSVSCELNHSIEQAARIIAAKDYERILLITGADRKESMDDSMRLLFHHCENFGIHLTSDHCIATENTLQGGAIAARQILNMKEKPQLVITMNTILAFGAIPFLARNQFVFTKDAELLTFGQDQDIAHLVNYIPSLSLVAIPMESIALECFTIALQLAEGNLKSPIHYVCPSALMLNESFTI